MLGERSLGIAAIPEGLRKRAVAEALDGRLKLFDDRVANVLFGTG